MKKRIITRVSKQLTSLLLIFGLLSSIFISPFVYATPASVDTPDFVSSLGSAGSGNGEFTSPTGVAVDSFSNLYAVDSGNNRIQKFDQNGTYITQWGTPGTGNGQLDGPVGIAVDSSDNVYVTDPGNQRIQKFDQNGTYITQWGSFGSGNGEFNYPSALAFDSIGYIYVTDVYNARIQKFDQNGTYITQWGTPGTGNGEFGEAYDIALDNSNNVYVADSTNHRIQKFDQNGTYITQWGTPGTGNGEFDSPFGIKIDKNDRIYVMDTANSRIQKFDQDGNYLAQWGENGDGDGQFTYLITAAIDSRGAFYIPDLALSKIQKFSYPQEEASFVAVDPSGVSLGSEILLKTGSFTDFTCSQVVTESSLSAQDGAYTYPLGLVRFCLSVAEGSTQNIDVYFESSLAVNEVVARKFNSTNGQYQNISGASITEVTQSGKRYLKISYSVTDGGELDEDGAVNGEIIDPVGLAQLASSEQLASTGINLVRIQLGVVLLLSLGFVGLRIRRQIQLYNTEKTVFLTGSCL